MKSLVISVDFDGTIVHSRWPAIGEPLPNALQSLKRLHGRGHRIIINTCRAGKQADEARNWLIAHGVRFDAFNANLPELIARYGTDTRKISADLYIDDKSVGLVGVAPPMLWAQVMNTIRRLEMG